MKATVSFSLLACVLAMYIIASCQKPNSENIDPNTNPDTTVTHPPTPPKQIEYVNASLSGRVLDDNNLPVSGAVVKAGTASATTDINGSFTISNISLDKNAGLVKVEKDGFFQGSRTILVNAGVVNYISIQLIKKEVSGAISANTGGNVSVSTGGSINFAGNSFVNTGNSTAYTGTVSVSAFFINPAASNFNEIMPGTLRGINAGNQETALQSYGMMAVELTGAGGEKLQLASGKTATITFPIPAGLQANAPNTIPLWSFNDTTGLWKEEGTATKQGTNYVGTVSHFSFWNCDYPYALVDFKAVIKDQNGNPIYPAKVVLKTTGPNDTVSSYGYGYTDATGLVSGKIPAGKTFQLNVYNKCNVQLQSQPIGPFTTTADVGAITLNNGNAITLTISGSVINCNAASVTNGFVDVLLENQHNRVLVTNGNFSFTTTRCNNTQTDAVITAYDMSNNQNGPAKTVAVTSGTVAAGQLTACGNTVSEYVNFTFNGVNYNFIKPVDSIRMSKNPYNNQSNFYIYGARMNYSEQFDFSYPESTNSTVPLNYINLMVNQKQWKNQGTINVNITEQGAVGSYIGGNFTGTLKEDSTTNTAPVNFIFRIKRTQ